MIDRVRYVMPGPSDRDPERWTCVACRKPLPKGVKRPHCVGCSPYAQSVRMGDVANKRVRKPYHEVL